MNIAHINMIHYGSTGNIMLQIAETAREHGHSVLTISTFPYERKKELSAVNLDNHYIYGSMFENMAHHYWGILTGLNGIGSYFGTKELIKKLDEIKPDIVHLHNLHMFCIDLPVLFNYLKRRNIRVIWTLHDCWPFTGHCPYFTMIKCQKWKTGCGHCPQPYVYPKMYFDASKTMYGLKKRWFLGVKNMTIVTPSEWLAGLVRESFLKEYPTVVINNGIDLSVFKPTYSDFRKRIGIRDDQYMLLGVAFGWGERKGLDVIQTLAQKLPDNYRIVLVGTDDRVDASLPENVITIHFTHNQNELAQIYTAANLFINPTREENYPTVNMEALACGTPVLTFQTGGSAEIIDENCGSSVSCDDLDAFEQEIKRICITKPYTEEKCLHRALSFDRSKKFQEYISLYES